MIPPHKIVLHPFVTEKTMAAMDQENKLEFVVDREATKPQIRHAIEDLFDAKILSLNTKITTDGKKHAIVRFHPDTSAEDVGMRIGVF